MEYTWMFPIVCVKCPLKRSWCVLFIHLCVELLQLLYVIQQSGLGLCILQQSCHIKHVIQIGLDLDQQPVALCKLQLLQWKDLSITFKFNLS